MHPLRVKMLEIYRENFGSTSDAHTALCCWGKAIRRRFNIDNLHLLGPTRHLQPGGSGEVTALIEAITCLSKAFQESRINSAMEMRNILAELALTRKEVTEMNVLFASVNEEYKVTAGSGGVAMDVEPPLPEQAYPSAASLSATASPFIPTPAATSAPTIPAADTSSAPSCASASAPASAAASTSSSSSSGMMTMMANDGSSKATLGALTIETAYLK